MRVLREMMSRISSGRMAARVVSATGAVLDFLAPASCPACGQAHHGDQPANLLPRFCISCVDRIAPRIPDFCQRCAAPVGPFVNTEQGCTHCRTDQFAFSRVIRLGVYDDALRQLCLDLKHRPGDELAMAAAGLLWEREKEPLTRLGLDFVLPVPRHWSKRLRGSWHSPTRIALFLASRLRADIDTKTLVKIRRTPAQSQLTPRERRRNLKGAFAIRSKWTVRHSRVLLVDDVLTTGTTAQECSKVLLAAGAESVTVAVLARGLGL